MNTVIPGGKAKNDMIFIAALLIICMVVGGIYFFARAEGDVVTVTVDGELYGEYPLNVDRTVEIRVGDNLNVLVIENGQAHVAHASCPDGICSAHRPISKNGESIACLPNRVVITANVKSDTEEPDIIV